MAQDTQTRRYLLTINNPLPTWTHEEIIKTATLKFPTFEYLAMTDEIGEKETLHTHIILCFKSAVRFSTVKKNFNTAHIDSVKTTIQDCINYIRKQGKWAETAKAKTSVPGTFEEHGTQPSESKGKRGDLQDLYRMIVEEELSNAEILRLNADYILQIDKLDKIRTTFLQDKYKGKRRLDLEVIYVTGVTGKGKSRSILDEHGDENCYRVTDYTHPFDGYVTEPVLVFEEFRNSIPIKDMLNYLDIYPIQLAARYTNKYACYNRVYICTNWPFERQYEYEKRHDPESYEAFLRRIHRIKVYTDNEIVEYNNVKAYLDRNKDFRPIETYEQAEIPFSKKEKR